MPCYIPDRLASPDSPFSLSLMLSVLQDARSHSRSNDRPAPIRPCLRIAAAYRAQILQVRPDFWRAFEIFYRQHVRPQLCAGELRHWDAALQVPE